MSTDRDVNRIVRSWLEEGVSALPDRVLDTVLDQLPATPQRRALWPVRRFGEMNNYAKVAIAVMTTAVVAVIGINVMQRTGSVGGPGPTLSPTGSPISSLSPVPLPASGSLPAGTYAVENTGPVNVTFNVPDGWSSGGVTMTYAGVTRPTVEFYFGPVANVYTDACTDSLADPPVGPTVDALASALASIAGLEATTPTDVTLGGFAGKYLELSRTQSCPSGNGYRIWVLIDGTPLIFEGTPLSGGAHDLARFWILDVDGERLEVVTFTYPEATDQDRAELQSIVDSIQIQP
jgi:hypothetical protein